MHKALQAAVEAIHSDQTLVKVMAELMRGTQSVDTLTK